MARLIVSIIIWVAVLPVGVSIGQYEPAGCLNQDEELMAQLVNDYREANFLTEIPLSQTLTLVAQWHLADHDYATEVTGEYGSDPSCSQHSWYGIPGAPYTSCCYTGDPADYACMWDKPREISGNVYTENGFELAAFGYADVEAALQAWQNSPPHNDMILNQGMWSSFVWRAMGMGVSSDRYFVWFSTLEDPAGSPTPCVSFAPGDFDGNGVWDCDDVDALVAEIFAGTNNPLFDLTGDGVVNSDDLADWLVIAGAENLPSGDPYVPGDANLDGVIDAVDYNIMYDNFNMEGVGYCGGDFNADGIVGIADVAILCGNAPPGFCDDVVSFQQSTWGSAKAIYR
jgi:hypothetical protein